MVLITYTDTSSRSKRTTPHAAGFHRMGTELDITIACENDIPDLVRLLNVLFSQEVEFSPDTSAQIRGLEAIIRHPETGFILIGRIDGVSVGMVNILYTVSTAIGHRVAILEDMVVEHRYHGQGMGTQLLSHAVTEAYKNGCRRITLLTDDTNHSAHRFYEKYGFKRSTMIPFRIHLDTLKDNS